MSNNFDLPNEEFSHFEQTVISKYGPLMSSKDLVEALGFSSLVALRQARNRKNLDLKFFKIEKRSGMFALSVDVAKFLWDKRSKVG